MVVNDVMLNVKIGAKLILLIQTHDLSRYASAEILRDAGYEVIEASNGMEGLALLERHPFKLIIADVWMPKLTGSGLASRVRAKWPDLPILLTAHLFEESSGTPLTKPTEFMQKPIDAADLKATVQRLLRCPGM
jgi:hypothetical protein